MEPRCFPLLASLLLVPLLFPAGLPRAHTLGHAGTEAPSNPQEGSSGQGTNGSLLHHRVKRYLPPRTPPYAGKSSARVQNVPLCGNVECV
uniref:Uncharacterized protein n=1 Tax=Chinchilla lanigera TaxID=34839 RepID=A0A8C2W1G5_CHILA